jgi:probable rRNA maturation factor
MLIEINNTTKSKIDLALMKKATEIFLKTYQQEKKEVSIALVANAVIKKLNKIYRKKDKTTDVLSFSGEDNYLGEIIINYAQIKLQAKTKGWAIKKELAFILIHGLLHLIGYDDKTIRGSEEMERRGKDVMQLLL